MDLVFIDDLQKQTLTVVLLMIDIFTEHGVVPIQSNGEGVLPPEWLKL